MTHLGLAKSRDLAGSCQCGSVTYRVADEFTFAANCHCSICRRATGAAFKPLAGIEREKLCVTSGQDDIQVIDAEGWHDERCGRCGSFLFSVVRDGTFAHIAMGTIVDDPSIRPTAHIFVGSKAPWFTITDDLPQYEEHIVAEENQARGTAQAC
ncbi:GFA family protein [Rhizobium sp. HT1-10]|uniref:GFA family protein n=1 Tax=Rhizobium sp. HT1-10 TaxID=3111638 RepID=UPI003C2438C5